MSQCQFGAQFYSSALGKVYIDPQRCFGCGVCRAECQNDAIVLVPRHERRMWQMSGDNIVMPLPDHDFDPTEAAIPWQVCTSRAIGLLSALNTERSRMAICSS